MKNKKIIVLVLMLILIICVVGGVIFCKNYFSDYRYDKIKEDIQEDIAGYLRVVYPHCTPREGGLIITDEILIYQRGMDKEKLLDVDKKSYCKVRVEVRCVLKDTLEWNTYLKCKNYENVEYSNWENRG